MYSSGVGDAAGTYSQLTEYEMKTEAGRRRMRKLDLIAMGYEFVTHQNERKLQMERVQRQKTNEDRKAMGKQVDEEFEIERDAIASYQMRMSRLNKIKEFDFEIDKDLDTEILQNDQVFRDIKEVKGLLG